MGHISQESIKNLRVLLNEFTQRKHLEHFVEKYSLQSKKVKEDIITDLLVTIEYDEKKYRDFREWLRTFHLHGNNYFFVFDLEEHQIDEALLENIASRREVLADDLLSLNLENLNATKLIDIIYEKERERCMFIYLSPSEMLKKVKIADDLTKDEIEKGMYFSTAIIDLNLKQLIISINPTACLLRVDGVEKGKDFYNIADFYRRILKESVGVFSISKLDWVINALALLADEGTHHNNPKVTEEYLKYVGVLDKAVVRYLKKADVTEQPLIQYVQEEVQEAFENILRDKYGVIDGNCGYKVFQQRGDQPDSWVYVSSKTAFLNQGRAAKLAKASRNHSDITLLGIERIVSKDETYKFYIEIGKGQEYFLINPKSIRFAREEVTYELIRKISSYREKIELAGEDNPECE